MSKSWIITEVLMPQKLAPIHPGEVLLHDFLEPLGLSQYRLAHDIGVPPRRLNEIIHGTRAVSADTALRLARYFRLTPQFWLTLQMHHDVERERDRLGDRLVQEVKIRRTTPARRRARVAAAR
jgi:addiction module HigA family antidote